MGAGDKYTRRLCPATEKGTRRPLVVCAGPGRRVEGSGVMGVTEMNDTKKPTETQAPLSADEMAEILRKAGWNVRPPQDHVHYWNEIVHLFDDGSMTIRCSRCGEEKSA